MYVPCQGQMPELLSSEPSSELTLEVSETVRECSTPAHPGLWFPWKSYQISCSLIPRPAPDVVPDSSQSQTVFSEGPHGTAQQVTQALPLLTELCP